MVTGPIGPYIKGTALMKAGCAELSKMMHCSLWSRSAACEFWAHSSLHISQLVDITAGALHAKVKGQDPVSMRTVISECECDKVANGVAIRAYR